MTDASDLVTAFTARVDAQTVLQLTRQNDPTNATSTNSALLTTTATDAVERFSMETGIAFDSSQNYHLTLGVDLMRWFLMDRGNMQSNAEKVWANSVEVGKKQVIAMRAREVGIAARDADLTKIDYTNQTHYSDFDPDDPEYQGVYPNPRGTRR